jgi:hypothetical protein
MGYFKMNRIGVSTGAIAKGDYLRALHILDEMNISTIEISALRERELIPLVNSLEGISTEKYKKICFHTPGKLENLTEIQLLNVLEPVIDKGWPIIAHPDIITNYKLWNKLGAQLCIENMDARKHTGRDVNELKQIFNVLPSASLCFDIGHARQIDRTMHTGVMIVHEFKERIKVIHYSEVDMTGAHKRASVMAMLAFQPVFELLPKEPPIIIESPVDNQSLITEIKNITDYLLLQKTLLNAS